MRILALLLFLLPASALAAPSLLDVICDGDNAIQAALEKGANVNALDDNGDNALLRLLRCGASATDPAFQDSVRLLLDAGVDIHHTDAHQRTALMAALEHAGSDAGPVNLYIDSARLLLARGADPLHADDQGVTPLQLAASEANALVSQLLLDLGADPLRRDQAGHDALWYAVHADGNLPTFSLLLSHAQATLKPERLTGLAQQAASERQHNKLDLMLQQFPDLEPDPAALTASLARALHDGADVMQLERLTRAGASPGSLQGSSEEDLAWRLAMLDKADALKWLLDHGWQLNQLPASGYPSLYFANARAVQVLLDAGADANLRGDVAGTVLVPQGPAPQGYDLAQPGPDAERSQRLLAAGYQPGQDALGHTDLALAVRADDLALVRQLLPLQPPTADNIEAILSQALKRGRLPMLQTLLRASPLPLDKMPHLLTNYLLTPTPDPVLVEALLVAGVSANAIHSSDDPALLLAARRQLWPLVALLLRYGADPKQANAQGCTLRCYEWSMPDTLRAQLQTPGSGWRPPALEQFPYAFFALALSPLLVLWLLHIGWRLARRRALWPPTLWMAAALITAVLVGGALFYRCQPCVLQTTPMQMALTALVAVSAYLMAVVAMRMRQ